MQLGRSLPALPFLPVGGRLKLTLFISNQRPTWMPLPSRGTPGAPPGRTCAGRGAAQACVCHVHAGLDCAMAGRGCASAPPPRVKAHIAGCIQLGCMRGCHAELPVKCQLTLKEAFHFLELVEPT